MSCDARRDDVLLLAVGLLEEPEASALRAHLAGGCAACASHLCEARAVEASLALATDSEEPSRALRAELLRRVARAPGQAADVRALPVRASARLALAAALAALVAAPLGWLAASRRQGAERAHHAAALAALQEQSAGLERDLAGARDEQGETDDELAELEARTRGLESDLKRAERQVALLAAPGVVTLELAGTAQPEAHARVYWDWDDYYCYLRAEKLAPAAAPRVYALWLGTERGDRILAGTFVPEAGGEGTLWVQLPRDMGRAVSAAITLEPGAPGPIPAGPEQLRSEPRHS